MNFAHPYLDQVLKIGENHITTLVIEQPRFFRALLKDINQQIEGEKGSAVLSDEKRVLPFDRNAEIIDSFLNFQLSRKALLTKIANRLESTALDEDHYLQTMQLTGRLEEYILELADDLPCNIYCAKMSIGVILRTVGVDVVDDAENDLERLLNHMELTRELEHERLFILVNLRSYYPDEEVEAFFASALAHKFLILPVDSVARRRLKNEQRITVDEDLCEF